MCSSGSDDDLQHPSHHVAAHMLTAWDGEVRRAWFGEYDMGPLASTRQDIVAILLG